jgi:hypothetical protein
MSFGEPHRRAAALSPWPNLARRPNDASRPGSNSERPAIRHTTARSDCEAHTASERPRRTSVANGEGEHLTARSNRRTARSPSCGGVKVAADGAHRARSDRPTRRLTRRGSTEEPWHARQVFERHLPGRSRRWCFTARRQSVGGRAGVYPMCTRAPILDLDENYQGRYRPVNTDLIAVPPAGFEPATPGLGVRRSIP